MEDRTLTERVQRLEGIMGIEDRTLTERVQRLEGIMGIEGFSGCDQVVTGVGGESTQRDYNERFSRRIDRDHAKVEDHREQANLAPQQTALEEVINRIQNSTSRILERACMLEAIGARIMGALPEEKTDGVSGANRGPDGTLNHTHLALNALDHACSRLDAAALRLERV